MRWRTAALTGVLILLLTGAAHAAQEVGENDFRISQMGPDADQDYDAFDPDIAYNPLADEYLVVWEGTDTTPEDYEIWGQRIDAATGNALGPNFMISQTGAERDAYHASVAFASGEYLIVWEADTLTADAFEIEARRVAADGTLIGDVLTISETGAPTNTARDATNPDVAASGGQFLIVWEADANTNDTFEVFGRTFDPQTGALGMQTFPVSGMPADDTLDALVPAVAPFGEDGFYVVWQGSSTAAEEYEIFGAAITEMGAEEAVRLSQMGLDGEVYTSAFDPALAFNPTTGELLVVWRGDEDIPPLVDNEYEVFGQLVDASAQPTGPDDFRISDMGPPGDNRFPVFRKPDVAFNGTSYFVVWFGIDGSGEMVEGELEVFGQELSSAGQEIGANDLRLSDMGTDGADLLDGEDPAVAAGGHWLTVWRGDDDTNGLVNNEFEIYGQFSAPETFAALDDATTVAEGGTVNLDLLANDTGSAPLSAAVAAGPAHGTASITDGVLTYTHDDSETTEDSLVYQLSGEGGQTDTATVTITITPVNEAPTLAAPPDRTDSIGQALTLTLDAADPEGDLVTLSAEGLPPGLSLAGDTISGVPSALGSYTPIVTATDSQGAAAQVSLTWAITLSNPDFEADDLSAWQAVGGGTRICLSFSCVYLFNQPGGTDLIEQQVPQAGTAGQRITLRFTAGWRGVDGAAFGGARITLFYADGTQEAHTCPFPVGGTSAPQPQTCELVAAADFDSLAVALGWARASAGLFGVDDVQVTVE